MSEINRRRYDNEPEHRKNASKFISDVLGNIAPRFRNLAVRAVNQTDEDLRLGPRTIEAAKLESDLELVRDLRNDDQEAERESALSTSVFVSLQGDDSRLMQLATFQIQNSARQLMGRNVLDSGINQSGTRQGLEKVLGHRPEHEDLPLLQRYLMYLFK